jgi:hypothetical protein
MSLAPFSTALVIHLKDMGKLEAGLLPIIKMQSLF